MKTLRQAFSQVNTSMADEGLNVTSQASYIDMAQIIIEEIARDTELWQEEKWYYIAQASPDTAPTQQSESVAQFDAPSNDIITVPDYTTRTFAVQPSSAKNVMLTPDLIEQKSIVIPASENIWQLLRVTRGGFECKEYTKEEVRANLDFNRPFPNNDTEFNGLAFYAQRKSNGEMEIVFAMPFIDGEGLYMNYTTEKPVDITKLDANTTVPDFVYPAVIAGMQWLMHKRFFSRGNDSSERRVVYFKREYDETRYRAMAYARNLKNRKSVPIMQPVKWLSDQKTIYY